MVNILWGAINPGEGQKPISMPPLYKYVEVCSPLDKMDSYMSDDKRSEANESAQRLKGKTR